MRTIIVCLSVAGLLSCAKAVTPDCQPKANVNCVCQQIYNPVCGCDGRTYGNACEAQCAGVRYTPGACAGK